MSSIPKPCSIPERVRETSKDQYCFGEGKARLGGIMEEGIVLVTTRHMSDRY
jgi:hypothetical protein